MKVLASSGREDVAMVYIAALPNGKLVEFVESVQPPLPREKKWVLILSTLFGCPVGCLMCDAGSSYKGKLSKAEILAQIDFLVRKRFPSGRIPAEKFKVQFARMGEPAFNSNVLNVLEELRDRYDAPGLLPSISTIAPIGTDRFFEKLLEIKKSRYTKGQFQLQFSIHTTDAELRDKLTPVRKWGFTKVAEYGEQFYEKGDRKIALNFALARNMPLQPEILFQHFDPGKFLVKITPVNPTYQAVRNGLSSYIDPYQPSKNDQLLEAIHSFGYELIVSIGVIEENHIGSNCGQYVMRHLEAKDYLKDGYTFQTQVYSQGEILQVVDAEPTKKL